MTRDGVDRGEETDVEDIAVLKQSLPYIQRFKGTTFVVKFGGEAMTSDEILERLIEDITLLHLVGIRVMVVHGGGKHVTKMAEALGVETKFVGGRRVTDEQTLDVLKMVLSGKISVEILSLLKKKGVKAMGVSGVAAGVIEGLSNTQIASRRDVSPETIKTQVANVFAKAGVANRYEFLRLALRVDLPVESAEESKR